MSKYSLTQALIASNSDAFKAATQSEFLTRAAQGRVPKHVLGQWLANDRLYIHGYIRGVGRLLSFLQLPEVVPAVPADRQKFINTRLLNWLIDALVGIRREENFFVDTASRYGINVNLPTDPVTNSVRPDAKLDGLRKFEALFDGLEPGVTDVLPWLECAIVFWGTEKCYLEAWSGARDQLTPADHGDNSDADGGALRQGFIPNWSSKEFTAFVDELGEVIDLAVVEHVERLGDTALNDIFERALIKWRELLAAEMAFWPVME